MTSDPMLTAARWLTRRRTTVMRPSEIAEFDAWLEADPAHERAFTSVERAWSATGPIEDDPAIIEARDHDEATLHAWAERRSYAAIAASLAIAAFGGLALWRSGVMSDLFAPPPAQEFRTSIGQRTTFTLLDGTIVTLDTDSALRARLSGSERRIELERGRAFFQVARDKSRPFIVAAAGKTVRATGTAFDVQTEEGRFIVTLAEGRVQVREADAKPGGPVADMRQGWRLAVADDAQWRMAPVDITQATSWRDGVLIFKDVPIADAVAEMNRYSTRKIVFSGEPPQRSMIGRFQAGDVQSFAEAVELNKTARIVSQSKDRIELAAR